MKALTEIRYGIGISPIDTTGATTNGTAFDTRTNGGAGFAVCIVQTGNVAADVTTLKLQQSDDNSSWVDITDGAFTAPLATGGDNTIRAAWVPLGGTRRRYLRVTVTGGAGATLVSAVWLAGPISITPNSATESGLTELLTTITN